MIKLTEKSYEISGNRLRVWRDEDAKLLFVVDETINEYKPNVLLVVRPDGGRKWDDILSNDYGIDLETVRPKRNNKYQRLDTEYSGLNFYEKLIDDYESGRDVEAASAALLAFQYNVARHSAVTRLSAAMEEIVVSTDTIEKSGTSISELTESQHDLRTKFTAASYCVFSMVYSSWPFFT